MLTDSPTVMLLSSFEIHLVNTIFFFSFADFQGSSSPICHETDLSNLDDESHEIVLFQGSQCEDEGSNVSYLEEDPESTSLSYLEILNRLFEN